MLAFRSEAHLDRWLDDRGHTRGATLSVAQQWELARIWYRDRMSPDYRRRSPAEAEAVFASIGLTGSFWRLT
ncbi:MAG TPA: hypothetical protein VM307_11345 [Egibacteraceae bacterium]|nr:hypothetical protein [Egibacteraceae bacterium]